jgi:hypothetical protein
MSNTPDKAPPDKGPEENRGQSEWVLISRTPKSEDNPRTEVFDGKASKV